jgi:predicted  nucleic acid-binding Zn-ribbon protein
MNKYLTQLVELNKYDKKIEGLVPLEKSIKRPLTTFEIKVRNTTAKLEKLEDEIKTLILKKSKNELLISELKDKLQTIAEKTTKVKTAKEAKALTLEEELAKEQIESANEEIAKFDNLVELKKQEKKQLEKEIESYKAQIVIIQNEIQDKLDTLEKQKEAIYKNRDELMKSMDSNIYKFYEKIKKWAGNSAVSPVRKQACMGCYMKINDKTYAEVIKGDEIVSCPHCGRVLFIETEENE